MGTADTTQRADDTDPEPITAGDDLTRFQLDCLFVTVALGGVPDASATAAPCGLGIKDALDAEYGPGAVVNHGRLYPNLDTLIRRGLLAREQKDRRTNAYRVTDDGAALVENRVSWTDDCLFEGFTD